MAKRAAQLSFEGGHLCLKLSGHEGSNGEGEFIIQDSDMSYEDDGYRHLIIAPSEVVALAQFLHEYLQQVEPIDNNPS